MGGRKAWALAWLLAATLLALLLQAPAARGDELLVNGGFEAGTIDPWAPQGGDLGIAAGLGQNSSAAGVFVADDSYYHCVKQCVPAWEGNAYTFQGYAATASETGLASAFLVIRWYAQEQCYGGQIGGREDNSEVIVVEPPGSWQPLTFEVGAAPPTSRSAQVRIVIEESNAKVYLDEFSFTGPLPPTTTPTPTPSPTVSPSPSPEPIASPVPSPSPGPSPTAVATATQAPTPEPPTPSPSPTASSWQAVPLPAGELTNGGFEEADDEGRPLGWRKYGGELSRSSAARWEGRFAAVFTTRTTSTKWVFQTVAVQGGEAYVLDGYALKNDANVEAAYLRLSWYASLDGSGRAIASVDSTSRLADDSPDFRFLTTGPVLAPAEAASAKVRLMLDPVSEVEGKVYFDAVSFQETVMPLPTQTPAASPPPEETATLPETTQTLVSPSPGGEESRTTPTAAPAGSVDERQPPSSPTALLPPPTALAASSGEPDVTASLPAEPSQTEAIAEDRRPGTPVVLHRERRTAQSTQGGESVTAGSDDTDGLSPIVLALATASPAAAAAAMAFFVWQRWKKRARPP